MFANRIPTIALASFHRLRSPRPGRLFAEKTPDWANYVLYGDAAWQW